MKNIVVKAANHVHVNTGVRFELQPLTCVRRTSKFGDFYDGIWQQGQHALMCPQEVQRRSRDNLTKEVCRSTRCSL